MRLIKNPAVWIGFVISAVALALALRGLEWSQVGESIRDADYALLALGAVVLFAAIVARTTRWGVLFLPEYRPHAWHLFGGLNVGYALNNILPLRVGELGRAYLFARKEQPHVGRVLSTIVIERTLDTITVVVLLMCILPFIDAPAWARGPAILVGLAFLLFAVALAAAARWRGPATSLIERLSHALPEGARAPIRGGVDAALDGFGVISRPAILARALFWSALAWALSALNMYIVMRAFDLDVPFTAGVFVMCATALSMVVPSSPGHIGVFHAIATESLVAVFDVDRNAAASFALVEHAMLYLMPIVLAGMYAAMERETFTNLPVWHRPAAAEADL